MINKSIESNQAITKEVEEGKELISDAKVNEKFQEIFNTDNQFIASLAVKEIIHLFPESIQGDLKDATGVVSMVKELKPSDTHERMLIAQLVACHVTAMKFLSKAMSETQYHEAIDKNISCSTKLMRAFNMHHEALMKYRGKGQQTIQVQHINIQDNAQAIVGSIKGG